MNSNNEDCLYSAMKNAPEKPIKKKANKKLEKDEQKAVAELFVKDGWEVIKYNSGVFKVGYGYFQANYCYNTGVTAGHADLKATKDGTTIAIEVKKPVGGKVSDAQKAYREASAKCGNMTIICRTKEAAREFITYTHNLESIRDSVNWFVENYKQ